MTTTNAYQPVYPPAHRVDVITDYHGNLVADPYRWLEDATAPETCAWVEAQNRLTCAFLDPLPAGAVIRERLTAIWNYPKYSVPYQRGGRYFFMRNDGLQPQFVLCTQETLDAKPRVVLDPNTLSADGTVAVTNQAISPDGRLLAYALSHSGSDWQEIRVRAIDGDDYPDVIRWCRFTGIAWRHDNSGFFYNRYPEPGSLPPEEQTSHNRVYWHALGTPQETDQLVYAQPDTPDLAFSPFISDDGAYLLLNVWRGSDPSNRLYYRPVDSDGPFVQLFDAADAKYWFIDNIGTTFYIHTNQAAPRGRVIAIDLEHPERENWREVVPQHDDDTLSFATLVNNQLVLCYLHDAAHQLKIYDLDGRYVRDIQLPTLGTVVGLTGQRNDTELLIGLESFLFPTSTFRYTFANDQLKPIRETVVDFAADAYETQQVFATSADGTRVPLFLVHKKGLIRDGCNPTLLYGYGGFNNSLTPGFLISRLLWLEHGGVFVVANLRGGGEYGEEWHRAGMLEQKQNVFDDFIAAAEWLVANGYTSPAKLAIIGGSNGGLLVAACMLQRPELFGAVVCQVPVLDMLRYHRFTVGRYWASEYGNAETNPEHFRFLYAYSPLHNVRPGVAYPPLLLTTADTDDRVVPAHAYKFAAAIQAAEPGANPALLRVEVRAGHGLGKPTTKVIAELSDIYAFLFKVLGIAS